MTFLALPWCGTWIHHEILQSSTTPLVRSYINYIFIITSPLRTLPGFGMWLPTATGTMEMYIWDSLYIRIYRLGCSRRHLDNKRPRWPPRTPFYQVRRIPGSIHIARCNIRNGQFVQLRSRIALAHSVYK